ncbi:chromogranin-A isoform X5 [Vulpes vulpes]|uniref:Chromogranin-A n=1 Tax=Vulpes vulpes TaxID=9627 RepID=A0ABM5AR73_VULVU
MRSAAVLALLLCAGQAIALPVSSPMNKGDTEVMKCIVEVISDTLSKPSPMPVSQECFETLRGGTDERILSILRHQNLLKELQDLALQGAKERAHQKKHSGSEDGLAEAPDKQNDQAEQKEVTGEASPKDAVEKREDPKETENDGDTDGARPQASQEPGQGPQVEGDSQAPGQQEAANTHSPASLPGQKHPDSQAEEDSEGLSQGLVDTEKGPDAEQGQQAKREEEEEEEETGEKAATEEENPTEALNPHPSLGHQETHRGESWPEAQAVDEARKTGAKEARPPEGEGEREHSRQEEEEEEEEEEMAEAPRGLFRGGKNRELEQEQKEEQLSKDWEGAKRWRMDQLAKELTAKKGLQGEDEDDDPDRSMKLSFRARAYDFRGPGLPLRRGWRPTSREDSVEASLPLQDQELETLTTIEAELEKVAQQLQALRRG